MDGPFEFGVAVVRGGFRGKDGDVYVVEVGATDDVVVGYDVARGVPDETGAGAEGDFAHVQAEGREREVYLRVSEANDEGAKY